MAGCDWFESVSAWHDGEVSEDEARQIEAHVGACVLCQESVAMCSATRSALQRTANASVPARTAEQARAMQRPASPSRRWRSVLVLGLAAALGAGALLLVQPSSRLASAMADELVRHHLKGFAREKPCELESDDPEEVARWLTNALGYTVAVPSMPGARLLGARLCGLEGERTAAIMYVQDETPLTVFVPKPGSGAAVAAEALARGDSVRCERGSLGNAICATNARQPMLAVAEISEARLAAALRAP